MKTKEFDIPYCGCDIEKIKNANPVLDEKILDLYIKYQKERTNVYYKKEVLKESPPWTEWDVLQKYKFTNTRRELDRESKILIENVLLRDDVSDLNKTLNSIFCRGFYSRCYPVTLLEDRYLDFERLNDEKYKNYVLETLPRSAGDTAYLTSGYRRAVRWKMNASEEEMIKSNIEFLYIHREMFYSFFWDIKSPLELCKFPFAIGKFLVYQVFVDMTYIPYYKFSENEFVLSGPGCDRGIHALCKDLDGLTEEEFMFWLRDNIQRIRPDFNPEEMFHFLPEDQRNWGVMQIENSFCELSKCLKVAFSDKPTGKVRKYKSEEITSNSEKDTSSFDDF